MCVFSVFEDHLGCLLRLFGLLSICHFRFFITLFGQSCIFFPYPLNIVQSSTFPCLDFGLNYSIQACNKPTSSNLDQYNHAIIVLLWRNAKEWANWLKWIMINLHVSFYKSVTSISIVLPNNVWRWPKSDGLGMNMCSENTDLWTTLRDGVGVWNSVSRCVRRINLWWPRICFGQSNNCASNACYQVQ